MTNKKQTIVSETVTTYGQAHTGARSMRSVTGTISQASKALGGIGSETITIGRTENKEKIVTTVENFFASLDIPYGGGRVIFGSIRTKWNPYLINEEGGFMLCKSVVQRTKIGKQSYVLYRKDADGKYKAVSVYQPTAVRETGWTPYLICEGLAQSKFIEETKAQVEASKAEFERMSSAGELYVHDELTGDYVPLCQLSKAA